MYFYYYAFEMTLSSTIDIEAALYNEHTLAWEPLIEPTNNAHGTRLVPWNITCLIIPVRNLIYCFIYIVFDNSDL